MQNERLSANACAFHLISSAVADATNGKFLDCRTPSRSSSCLLRSSIFFAGFAWGTPTRCDAFSMVRPPKYHQFDRDAPVSRWTRKAHRAMAPSVSNVNTSFPVSGAAVPTDEEAAAIMAATEALWPRASVLGPVAEPRNTAWRFSSRSWARPLPVRRLRPWR